MLRVAEYKSCIQLGFQLAGNPNIKDYGFKPGQSGNPSGKPKGLLTRDAIAKIVTEMMNMTEDEIRDILADAKEPMKRKRIAELVLKNDVHVLDFLLNRSVGKVTDVLEQHNHEHPVPEGVPTDSLLKLVAGK